MPHDLSELFDEEPPRWSLRGDPWLWREMRERFQGTPVPASSNELAEVIGRMFKELTGKPITHPDYIFVARYAHGGMSSGMVVPQFWRETLIPLLTARHSAA